MRTTAGGRIIGFSNHPEWPGIIWTIKQSKEDAASGQLISSQVMVLQTVIGEEDGFVIFSHLLIELEEHFRDVEGRADVGVEVLASNLVKCCSTDFVGQPVHMIPGLVPHILLNFACL
jgi:hypothetical protein